MATMVICSIALILEGNKPRTLVHLHNSNDLGCEPADLKKAAEIALQVEKLWAADEAEGAA